MKIIYSFLVQLFFLFAGLGLFYLSFRGQSWEEVWSEINKVDFSWFWPVLALSFFNHIVRALRWQLLLLPIRPGIRLLSVFLSMMAGYFINLTLPRLGEISKSVALAEKEKIPVAVVLGTVFTERLLDIFCLFLIILFTLVAQTERMLEFFRANVFTPLWLHSWKAWPFLILFIFFFFAGFFLFYRFRSFKVRFYPLLRDVFKGIKSMTLMPHPFRFIGFTFLLWFTYYWMTALWFYSLPATLSLGPEAGLALLAVGSLGRSVPIQGGGMGAYHFLFTQCLLLFGIPQVYGFTLSVIVHGVQTFLYLIVGGLCYFGLLFLPEITQNDKKNHSY